MPIYIRCPICLSDQNIRTQICKNCSSPMPKQGKRYKVVVKYMKETVTKQIHSLDEAKKLESKIKSELIEGMYFNRRKVAPTVQQVWEKYSEDIKLRAKGLVTQRK